MALTNDPALARAHGAAAQPRHHPRRRRRWTRRADGPWYYEQIELGFNYRMTDIQAALGLSQLTRLDDYRGPPPRARRPLRRAAARTCPSSRPGSTRTAYSGLHLYVVRLRLDAIGATHREVFERMRAAGIGVNLHYIPVYRQPYYRALRLRPRRLPRGRALLRRSDQPAAVSGADRCPAGRGRRRAARGSGVRVARHPGAGRQQAHSPQEHSPFLPASR